MDIAHKLIDFKDYYDLFNKYETLEKISFDYAVVEKEEKIQVMRYEGKWKDLGTWNTLTESMDEKIMGKGKAIVDGVEQVVKAGDVITMKAGSKHTIMPEEELKVIEVQLGKEINVTDKRKFQLEK